MEYPLTSHCINLLKSRIEAMADSDGTPSFQEVRGIVMSGPANLWELVPEISFFPCAVITSGLAQPLDHGATREVEIAVIVIDEFRADSGDLAGYDLIDRTFAELSPQLPGAPLKLENIHYVWQSTTPVELIDSQHTAWNITFSAKMSFKQ